VLRAKQAGFLVGRVEVWALGAVRMHTPLAFHVDHPIGRVGLAKQADAGLVGRVEGWYLGAVWMRTPLVFHVDHPIGRVGLAKQSDAGLVGRVEGFSAMFGWLIDDAFVFVKVGKMHTKTHAWDDAPFNTPHLTRPLTHTLNTHP
jgi:hypothetical protein